MRILVGCEESQTVTKAFRDKGYEAYSCDLVETRGNPDWHIQGDVMDNLEGWDLIILHPDCTKIALSGNRWYARGMPRYQERLDAVEWTLNLWMQSRKTCQRVALENPKSVIFPRLKELGANIQYVQPYNFGHLETKETGFALHGLPELVATNDVKEEMDKLPAKEKHRIHHMSPGPNRKRDRSKTYSGIAEAIADQWPVIIDDYV